MACLVSEPSTELFRAFIRQTQRVLVKSIMQHEYANEHGKREIVLGVCFSKYNLH